MKLTTDTVTIITANILKKPYVVEQFFIFI